jgi:tRNA (cmo5U34)-methyltransferase
MARLMRNSWSDPDHSARYLARAGDIPHRHEGDGVILDDVVGTLPGPVLDLGCGDGRLSALVLDAFPGSTALLLDFSPTMLAAARRRFDGHDGVRVVRHDLDDPLPTGERFAAVISSLAIHHVDDDRKRVLFSEIADRLEDGGVFCNLDVVRSPTPALHARWRADMGVEDDPSDHLTAVGDQLGWMRDAGLDDVDCIWKWRGLALMRGARRAR